MIRSRAIKDVNYFQVGIALWLAGVTDPLRPKHSTKNGQWTRGWYIACDKAFQAAMTTALAQEARLKEDLAGWSRAWEKIKNLAS